MLFPQRNLLVSPSDSAAGTSHDDAMPCRILTENIFTLSRGLVASLWHNADSPIPCRIQAGIKGRKVS